MPHLGVDAWGSYDEHGNVAPKTEPISDAALEAIAAVTASQPEPEGNEREQVQQVFGLTGGELMDVEWETHLPHVETHSVTFTYWYHGVPEYVSESLQFPISQTYRTVCESELYGMVPERVTDDEGTWKVVARYSTSGEVECPCRNSDNPDAVSVDNPCPLCGADGTDAYPITEPVHGYIYIGDGWAEIVYRLQEPPEVHGELAIQEHVSERGQSYVDTGIPLTTFTIDVDRNERHRALRLSCDAGQLAVTLPRYAVNELTRVHHEIASFYLRVWDLLYAYDRKN